MSKEVRRGYVSALEEGSTVFIDGFNTVISLEIALSGGTLLQCMDQTVRDLAGLRGTYRLIDKTPRAVRMMGEALKRMQIGKAVLYLDAPVSNTGHLAACLRQELDAFGFDIETRVIHNVDSVLSALDNVITGDAVILDRCISWVNLVRSIVDHEFPEYPYVRIDDIGPKYDEKN